VAVGRKEYDFAILFTLVLHTATVTSGWKMSTNQLTLCPLRSIFRDMQQLMNFYNSKPRILQTALGCLFAVFCLGEMCGQQLRNEEFGTVYYEPNLYKTKYNVPNGSPYLDEAFTAARINERDETHFVRFDAVEGVVEVQLAEDRVIALDNSIPYTITLLNGTDQVYETHEYINPKGDKASTFLQVVHSSENYTLFVRENKKYFKEVKAQGYAAAEPAGFKKAQDQYYIRDKRKVSGSVVPIPGKSKDFREFFEDDAGRIKSFIKANKLSISNSQDLVAIFDYYFEQ
jgi:hypothetical protein